MAQLNPISSLRKKAETILNNKPEMENLFSNLEKVELIKEITLAHIELKLQNDEIKQNQLSIREAYHQYNSLFDSMPLGCFLLNHQGKIINANPRGAALLGFRKSFLLSQFFFRYVAPESQEIFSEFFHQAVNTTQDCSTVIRVLKKNGPIFFAKLESKKLGANNPETEQFFLVVTDVTHLSTEEKKIHGSKKQLAHFGQATSTNTLAATITQQLNHPLAVISNYLHGCINHIKAEKYKIKDILTALVHATKQLQYISDVILRLKNFSYKMDSIEEVCLNTLIKDTLGLLKPELANFSIKVQYLPIPGAPKLKIDKIHIQQVLINLIRNAIESMRDAGTIQPRLTIEGLQISKRFVEISVTDNGPGFSPDLSHCLFDPQFTTKNYATGMGLALSRSIIKSHGGKLLASSNERNGACFKFTLAL